MSFVSSKRLPRSTAVFAHSSIGTGLKVPYQSRGSAPSSCATRNRPHSSPAVEVHLPIRHVRHVPALAKELHDLLARLCQLRPTGFGLGVLLQPPNLVPVEQTCLQHSFGDVRELCLPEVIPRLTSTRQLSSALPPRFCKEYCSPKCCSRDHRPAVEENKDYIWLYRLSKIKSDGTLRKTLKESPTTMKRLRELETRWKNEPKFVERIEQVRARARL